MTELLENAVSVTMSFFILQESSPARLGGGHESDSFKVSVPVDQANEILLQLRYIFHTKYIVNRDY